jgi:hypothetical protein
LVSREYQTLKQKISPLDPPFRFFEGLRTGAEGRLL